MGDVGSQGGGLWRELLEVEDEIGDEIETATLQEVSLLALSLVSFFLTQQNSTHSTRSLGGFQDQVIESTGSSW